MALPPLTRLAAIADALALGIEVDPLDARWLAAAVVSLAADGTGRLDAVLGLPSTWRRDLRHAQRDTRLRQLAMALPGSTSAKAAALQAMLRDYASNGWLRERHLSRLPDSASERRRLLHEVMRLDPEPPTSTRMLSAIVEDCKNPRLVIADLPVETAPTER